jgi:AcrR family transcriptional regulator
MGRTSGLNDSRQPLTARGEATRAKLLAAAEIEIGQAGFHAASVSSITRRAGVGQGTFYLYFASKEDALRELVRHMGRELRHALSRDTAGITDRLEVERSGFRAFVRFSLKNKNLYRVVMESQFVDESIYREYYETLASSYTRALGQAQREGRVTQGDAATLAWALMGVAHFLGLRHAIWEGAEPPEEVLETAFGFISRGLGAQQ